MTGDKSPVGQRAAEDGYVFPAGPRSRLLPGSTPETNIATLVDESCEHAAVDFWTYRAFPRQRARVHRSSCVWCNNGEGFHDAPDSAVGEWSPFPTYAQAIGALTDLGLDGCRPVPELPS